MDATPDMVGRMLRSWLATEVLTLQVTRDGWGGLAAGKQGQQRNKYGTAADGPGLWEQPHDDDPPPWPLREDFAAMGNKQDVAVEDGGEEQSNRPKPWHSDNRAGDIAKRLVVHGRPAEALVRARPCSPRSAPLSVRNELPYCAGPCPARRTRPTVALRQAGPARTRL